MKKRRPTIPLHSWKLAVHLEGTKNIQKQSSNPAYNCDCSWCQLWKSSIDQLLPTTVKEQLHRIGIEVSAPTDLYKFGDDKEHYSIRATFHLIGKVLSGPVQRTDEAGDKFLVYQEVRDKPYFSMSVIPEKQSLEYFPKNTNGADGDTLMIDFRIDIPKYLSQPANSEGV